MQYDCVIMTEQTGTKIAALLPYTPSLMLYVAEWLVLQRYGPVSDVRFSPLITHIGVRWTSSLSWPSRCNGYLVEWNMLKCDSHKLMTKAGFLSEELRLQNWVPIPEVTLKSWESYDIIKTIIIVPVQYNCASIVTIYASVPTALLLLGYCCGRVASWGMSWLVRE